jgi:hypothetical protein
VGNRFVTDAYACAVPSSISVLVGTLETTPAPPVFVLVPLLESYVVVAPADDGGPNPTTAVNTSSSRYASIAATASASSARTSSKRNLSERTCRNTIANREAASSQHPAKQPARVASAAATAFRKELYCASAKVESEGQLLNDTCCEIELCEGVVGKVAASLMQKS